MPRVTVPSFVGPSNTLSAIQAATDRTVNFYLESTAPGNAKAPNYLHWTPGLRPKALFPDQPIRGLLDINDLRFVVGGSSFAQMFSDYSFGTVYPLVNDGQPVSMTSNGTAGNQVGIASAGLFYVYNFQTMTFSEITGASGADGLPNPCRMVDFMDGYTLALKGGSRLFAWSALEDMTSWDALDVAEVSEAADDLCALIRNHREIWLLGFRTSEVWYDAGDVNNTFQPLQGVFLEHGALGPFAVQRFNDSLIWLEQDKDGACVVVVANGYQPQNISVFAVPYQLQTLSNANDATSMTFQMGGHWFYVLTIPESDRSWLYDVTMNVWTEWNMWDAVHGVWTPKVVGTHLYSLGTHLMGDRFSGAIYECSPTFYDEQIVAPV